MGKQHGFDYLVVDGQRLTSNYDPDSGAHSHLVIDAGGYTFEKICRDEECPVMAAWEDEQDAIAEADAERRAEVFYENLSTPLWENETDFTFYGSL